MFNVKKNKYLVISVFIILVIAFLVIITITSKKTNEKVIKVNSVDCSEIISNRYIHEIENKIIIGNNLKQIENGFYDVRLEYNNINVSIFFNKLYKEEYSEKLYVDESYLYEILNLINAKFSINIDERKLQELVVLIADKYMEYKNNIKLRNEVFGDLNNEIKYEIKFDEEFLVFNIKM